MIRLSKVTDWHYIRECLPDTKERAFWLIEASVFWLLAVFFIYCLAAGYILKRSKAYHAPAAIENMAENTDDTVLNFSIKKHYAKAKKRHKKRRRYKS